MMLAKKEEPKSSYSLTLAGRVQLFEQTSFRLNPRVRKTGKGLSAYLTGLLFPTVWLSVKRDVFLSDFSETGEFCLDTRWLIGTTHPISGEFLI